MGRRGIVTPYLLCVSRIKPVNGLTYVILGYNALLKMKALYYLVFD